MAKKPAKKVKPTAKRKVKKPAPAKRKAKKAAPKRAKSKKAKKASPAKKRRLRRVRPPTIEQLAPSGEPLFVTPLDKL